MEFPPWLTRRRCWFSGANQGRVTFPPPSLIFLGFERRTYWTQVMYSRHSAPFAILSSPVYLPRRSHQYLHQGDHLGKPSMECGERTESAVDLSQRAALPLGSYSSVLRRSGPGNSSHLPTSGRGNSTGWQGLGTVWCPPQQAGL